MGLLNKVGVFIWSKMFLINISLIIVLYIGGILILQIFLKKTTNFGQRIEVPNLVGENQNNLKNLIEFSGLTYQVLDSLYDPTKVAGTVLEQTPTASEISDIYVKEGRIVKVRVSKRTQLVEMPDLVDKSQRFAEGVLNSRDFRYKLNYKPSLEANGAVIEQRYKGKQITSGTKVPIGSKITLIIGRNQSGVAVQIPDLYGLTILEAKTRVQGMGAVDFFTICPTCFTSTDSLNALVESQSPEYFEGAMVVAGTTISVFATTEFNGQ